MMDTFKQCVVNNQNVLRVKCFIEDTDILDKSEPLPIPAIPKPDQVARYPDIPAEQFYSYWGVSCALIGLGWNWDKDDTAAQLIKVFSVYCILLFLPRFFGYLFILKYSQESRIKLIVNFEKIDFSGCKDFVAYHRWALIPFFWLCQIFCLIPTDTYLIMELQDGFPPREFLMSFLVVMGLYIECKCFQDQVILTKETGLDRTFKHLFNKW